MKSIIKRVVVLALAAVLVLSAIPCASYADNDDMPTVDELMDMLPNGVSRPKSKSMLDEPVEKYVMTKNGNYMYIQKAASNNGKKIDEAEEGSLVTVYAIQSGYALGIIEDNGQGGWFKLSLLSDEYYSGPNPSDTTDLDKGVERPKRDDYIDDYETMYVETSHGVRAQLLEKPSTKISVAENTMGYVYEGEEVTVLARRGQFAFIESESGEKGWTYNSVLTSEY